MAKPPSQRASSREVEEFLQKSRDIARFAEKQPRLLFAIDATASRQPTWDTACRHQREMFLATRNVASLAVQLCYYRGFNEFRATPWLTDSDDLAGRMGKVHCEGGHTQIARLLRHALAEHARVKIRALVFIGDAMEENPDDLCDLAGRCGLLGLPLFLFQEGNLHDVEQTFRTMARISGGAWARFDARSARTLAELLGAVASFAAGGRAALADNRSEGAKLLLSQLKP
jgi:hypothetical protein